MIHLFGEARSAPSGAAPSGVSVDGKEPLSRETGRFFLALRALVCFLVFPGLIAPVVN